MAVRILLGVPLTTAVVALFWWDHAGRHRLGFTLLVLAAVGLGLDEFYGIVRERGRRPAGALAIGLCLFLVLLQAVQSAPGHAVLSAVRWPLGPLWADVDGALARLGRRVVAADVLLAGLVVLVAEPVLRPGRRSVEDAWATCFGVAYVWFPLSLALTLRSAYATQAGTAGDVGQALVAAVFVSNKASDSAAYFCGKAFGRRPMAPVISPKKTWEGAAGGLIAGTAGGVAVLAWLLPGWNRWEAGAAFSAVLAAAGQLGDLAESAIKRWAGVKDSARRIPEFGGMLDMVDGFLLALPVAYLWLRLGGDRWVFGGPVAM